VNRPRFDSYSPRSRWGQLKGQRFSLPPIFWSLSEEEIVDLLVSYGYNKEAAAREAGLFMKYKALMKGEQSGTPEEEEEGSESPISQPLQKIQERLNQLLGRTGGEDAETE